LSDELLSGWLHDLLLLVIIMLGLESKFLFYFGMPCLTEDLFVVHDAQSDISFGAAGSLRCATE